MCSESSLGRSSEIGSRETTKLFVSPPPEAPLGAGDDDGGGAPGSMVCTGSGAVAQPSNAAAQADASRLATNPYRRQ